MKRLLLTLITLLPFLPSLPLRAEDGTGAFVRVSSMKEVLGGGVFVVGACNADGDFCAMSCNTKGGKAKETLLSVNLGKGTPGTDTDAALRWTITYGTDNFFTIQDAEGRYLQAVDAGKTHLTFDNSSTPRWQFAINADGTFQITNKTATNRYLAAYILDGLFFGMYTASSADEKDLILYRLDRSATPSDSTQTDLPDTGTATLPADGTLVTIGTADFFATTLQRTAWKPETSGVEGEMLTPMPADGYLLTDGTVAPGDSVQQWRISIAADGTFTLLDARTGEALAYRDASGATGTTFRLTDGRILTTEAEPRGIFLQVPTELDQLLADGTLADAYLVLLTREAAASTGGISDVAFLEIAPEPQQSFADGILTLSGGWNAWRLSQVDLRAVRCLDLSGLSLPLNPRKFASERLTRNMPIYVAESEASVVPILWDWVVAVDAEDSSASGTLVHETMLYDREPLYSPRKINFDAGDVLYERASLADHDWETLALPFHFALKTSATGYRYAGMADGVVYFKPIEENEDGLRLVRAHEAILIRTEETQISAASEISTYDETSFKRFSTSLGLWPNYDALTFTQTLLDNNSSAFYLLTVDGNGARCFCKATPGSTLDPFRAYLCLPASQQELRIAVVEPDAAGIDAPVFEADDASLARDIYIWYTLDGRRLPERPTQPGVYLNGHRRVLIR